MSLNPIAVLIEHAVASIQEDAGMPAAKKIKLLRACGTCVCNEKQAVDFLGAAQALEIAERRQQQLWLNFKPKTKSRR